MIYGSVYTWDEDAKCFPSAFARAMSFLEDKDLSTLKPGKYPIEGEMIFAVVLDVVTEPAVTKRLELHRKYIDIQFLISGKEQHLYAHKPLTNAKIIEDSLAEKDIAFYSTPEQVNSLILEAGDYAIYLPGELHAPCCAVNDIPSSVFKIVFKVRRDLI